ncbi:MAG: site-specific DNA-methyltransferase [Alphaproteobacteria bacterium]|nr:site-specific DNA-methyltransferase [Alphaproteobacteria bacterium]
MDLRTNTILVGDWVDRLRELPDACVHACITSPPYWGLRDYGVEGQLGLEATPGEYVEKLIEGFREVRRVLRDDGVCLLNLGDSYNSQVGNYRGIVQGIKGEAGSTLTGGMKNLANKAYRYNNRPTNVPGLKPKDLCGMPWRVALALQADGWWLRSAMPWIKGSSMPESCTDRPASALEYVFLLAKSARYYWDGEAVKVRAVYGRRVVSEAKPMKGRKAASTTFWRGAGDLTHEVERGPSQQGVRYEAAGRNFRNTDLYYESLQPPHGMIHLGDEPVGLDVNPKGFSEAHFATFPPKLVIPLIKASTSEKGCCPECGKPWERVVERHDPEGRLGKGYHDHTDDLARGQRGVFPADGAPTSRTIGWHPACECGGDPVPCTVLDPFMGAGTVAVVAEQLGRNWLGIELSQAYTDDIAWPRILAARNPQTYAKADAPAGAPLFAGDGGKGTAP